MSGLGTPARRFRLAGWSDPRPIALVLVIAAFCAVGVAEATGGGPTMPFGAIALRLMSELLLPLAGLGVALGLAAPIEAGAGLLAMAVGAGAGLVWRHDFLELVARLPNAASHAFLAGPIAGLGVGLLLLMPASLRRVLLVPVAALTGAMLLVVVKLLDPSLRDPHVPWLAGLGALALLLALANALRRVRHPVRFTAARILGSWVLAVAFLYGGASVATRGRAAIPSAPTRLAPPPDATLFRSSAMPRCPEPRAPRSVWVRIVAAVLALGTASTAAAHPDITMECRVLFNFEDGKVTGIGETWTFDEAFSAQLIADYDEDHDGLFDAAESGAMEREVFGNLSEIHYYTFLSINGREQTDLKPFGFRATKEGEIVTFAFGIRLPEPLDPALYPVTLELKDPEFAVYAVLTGDEPALLRGDTQKRCRAAIRDDRENPYFDGTVIPQEIRLVCGQ